MTEHLENSRLVRLAEAGNASGYYLACNSLSVEPDPLFKDLYDMGAAEAIEQNINHEIRNANNILKLAKTYTSKKRFLQDNFIRFQKKDASVEEKERNQDISDYSKEKIFGLYNSVIKSYQNIVNSPRSKLIAKQTKKLFN